MKPRIAVHLFDRLSVQCGSQELLLHASGNAKELLCYLIVNRRASVPRETLASLVAPSLPPEKSRKALRHALWQLRDGLSGDRCPCADRLLGFGEGWVQFTPDETVWLDVAEFERTAAASSVLGEGAATHDPKRLSKAVELYRGDFLQGWYQQWCLEERERLRQIYLETLDALVAHCEAVRDINAGVAYAIHALHADPARECTHRALMRLYRAAGDRSSALQQYERCVEAVRRELGMEPDDETRALEREIRTGHFAGGGPVSAASFRKAERQSVRRAAVPRRRPG
jgi:DNA-binding SARP family transcriptional activator